MLKLMHSDYRYMAWDSNLTWYAFKNKPEFSGGKWRSDQEQVEISDCFNINYVGTPADSLHERTAQQAASSSQHGVFPMIKGLHV